MAAIRINNYTFKEPLMSENSGFSKWGIGYRGRMPFFVKEFLAPVFPIDDAMFDEKQKSKRIELCNQFVQEKVELYTALREVSDGRIIAVEQLFRVGAKFYISTRAILDHTLSIAEIANDYFVDQLRLCCSIAHAMAGVHSKNIIHADIKPNNILVVRRGHLQANIIDFDCSFFEKNSPKLGEELNGDLVYLSPEGFLHIAEVESNITCKLDVFALGLVFCEYFTGALPRFDTNEYQYAYESVLDDHPLDLSAVVNEDCRKILERMLQKNPEDRPDLQTVFEEFNEILLRCLNRTAPQRITLAPIVKPAPTNDEFFKPAGNL